MPATIKNGNQWFSKAILFNNVIIASGIAEQKVGNSLYITDFTIGNKFFELITVFSFTPIFFFVCE